MRRSLVVHPRVEVQAAAARDWYEDQLTGLGDEFVDELDTAVRKAHRHPVHYQKIYLELRRVLLRRFPYALFFVESDGRVTVLAVLRQSEDPEKWDKLSEQSELSY